MCEYERVADAKGEASAPWKRYPRSSGGWRYRISTIYLHIPRVIRSVNTRRENHRRERKKERKKKKKKKNEGKFLGVKLTFNKIAHYFCERCFSIVLLDM
ncbi:hypothetical protein PUN28_018923 [Cardiocondyla obscurior]|uniref:Uncharacterized protein n=1 Tax=Cardiocondyla obscurior TaxID=286306 RepID=A0AAW2EI19_9HYME